MQLSRLQTVLCVWSNGLWDQKARRVKQTAVIYAELSADGRFDPKAQADRVGPDRPLILESYVIWWDIGAFENIAGTAKDVATVIERHGTDRFCKRDTSLDIYHCESVSAKRDREWFKIDGFAVTIEKRACRFYHDPRAGFFEIKSTQIIGSPREKSLADRQQTI